MVEANLALIAVCLPKLRGLFKTETKESLVRTLRSATHLRSLNYAENHELPTIQSTKHVGKHSDEIPGTLVTSIMIARPRLQNQA